MPNLACRYSADTLLECPTPLVLRPPCLWSVADKLHGMLTVCLAVVYTACGMWKPYGGGELSPMEHEQSPTLLRGSFEENACLPFQNGDTLWFLSDGRSRGEILWINALLSQQCSSILAL